MRKQNGKKEEKTGGDCFIVGIDFVCWLTKDFTFFAQDKFRFKIEGMKKMGHEGLTVAHGKTETKGGNTCSSVTAAFLIVFFFFGSQYTEVLASSANKPITNIRKKSLFPFLRKKKK